MMKKLLLMSSALLWCLGELHAQDYKVKLANSKDRKVTIHMDGGTVRIEGYDGDEISIQGSGKIAPPERAKGLKPLYYPVDNTGIGLTVNTENGDVTIDKASRKEANYTIRLPRKVAVLYQQTNWSGDAVRISNMSGDLEVRTNNAEIELNQVTGPVVANSTSGEIKIVYSALNPDKPSAISTVSGHVDVTMPTNAKTNLRLGSLKGEMYTDFDLNLKNAKNGLPKVGGGAAIEGITNGGGVEMQINTISGNIFLRKQK